MSALFISDLHIDETRPAVLAGLRRLVDAEAPSVDAIYILGDLVEVWVGDDDDGPVAESIREALATAAQRCEVYVMHGNRDFLIGAAFALDTGATLLEDPSVVEVDNDRVLLAHGDAYCTGDVDYQRLRALFRSSTWQSEVLSSTIEQRRALAASAARQEHGRERKQSRQHHGRDAEQHPSGYGRCRRLPHGPRSHPPARDPRPGWRSTPHRARRLGPLRLETPARPGRRRAGLLSPD